MDGYFQQVGGEYADCHELFTGYNGFRGLFEANDSTEAHVSSGENFQQYPISGLVDFSISLHGEDDWVQNSIAQEDLGLDPLQSSIPDLDAAYDGESVQSAPWEQSNYFQHGNDGYGGNCSNLDSFGLTSQTNSETHQSPNFQVTGQTVVSKTQVGDTHDALPSVEDYLIDWADKEKALTEKIHGSTVASNPAFEELPAQITASLSSSTPAIVSAQPTTEALSTLPNIPNSIETLPTVETQTTPISKKRTHPSPPVCESTPQSDGSASPPPPSSPISAIPPPVYTPPSYDDMTAPPRRASYLPLPTPMLDVERNWLLWYFGELGCESVEDCAKLFAHFFPASGHPIEQIRIECGTGEVWRVRSERRKAADAGKEARKKRRVALKEKKKAGTQGVGKSP